MAPRLKIAYLASELAPLAKTGGLADVAGSLPAELVRRGHDVRTFMPFHAQVDGTGRKLDPVDSVRDVRTQLGSRAHTYSVWTTPLPKTDASLYLIDCPELFHRASIYTQHADEGRRFALFSRAVLEVCQRLGWAPDVLHCNDWHSALVPLLVRTHFAWDRLFQATACLLTVHNLGYQGVFAAELIDDLGLGEQRGMFDQRDVSAGRVNFMRTGLAYADALSTVSPTYAAEIQTAEYGMGLEEVLRARSSVLVGILNGVDYEAWSPETDRFIPHPFSAQDLAGKTANKTHLLERLGLPPTEHVPLVGIVSRLVQHKGFELCFPVLPELLARRELRLVVLGSGEERFESFFLGLERNHRDRVRYHRGYHEELSHVIEAASDLFVMPSRYEPCGLNQMFSMRYGTIPVVRRTGGLADTVQPVNGSGGGTGFVFEHFTPEGLAWALGAALDLYTDRQAWQALMRNAMAQDFSWSVQAERYLELYRRIARS